MLTEAPGISLSGAQGSQQLSCRGAVSEPAVVIECIIGAYNTNVRCRGHLTYRGNKKGRICSSSHKGLIIAEC